MKTSASFRLAVLGRGSVAEALLPILAGDSRFHVAGLHSRSHPAAGSVAEFLDTAGADVLVELTTLNPESGEPATSHIREAFRRGMHVVTANKGPIAHAYHELQAEADRRGVRFRFESTVMDGTPVFNQFRNNLPRVRVLGFAGVLNSTTKLVVEAMENGGSMEDGLALARRIGVAEANASYDLDGWDSAAKAAALANVLMDADSKPGDVRREGISAWSAERVRALAGEGRTIRLVSRGWREGEGVRLSARTEVLDRGDVLASGGGASNLIFFETDLMGRFGIVSIEPGVQQTAYGVYADLVDILTGC